MVEKIKKIISPYIKNVLIVLNIIIYDTFIKLRVQYLLLYSLQLCFYLKSLNMVNKYSYETTNNFFYTKILRILFVMVNKLNPTNCKYSDVFK